MFSGGMKPSSNREVSLAPKYERSLQTCTYKRRDRRRTRLSHSHLVSIDPSSLLEMSTRARTRSATAASNVPIPQLPPRSRRNQVAAPAEAPATEEGRGIQKHDSEEKENHSKDVAAHEDSLSAAGRNVKRKLQTNGKAKGKGKAICTCRGQDDGTPMIECSRCGEWYVRYL